MCLAIAPNTHVSNNLLARVWRQIALTPLRLFLFAAIIHLILGIGMLLYNQITNSQLRTDALLSGFTFGILALPAFGFLMTWLPEKCSLSAVHYGRYSSIYLLLMLSLIMIEVGSLFNPAWFDVGMMLLVPAWLLALQGLWNLHVWLNSSIKIISKTLLILLFLNGVMLVFSVLGQMTGLPLSAMMSLLSLFLVWPLVMLVILYLVFKAPDSVRIISL